MPFFLIPLLFGLLITVEAYFRYEGLLQSLRHSIFYYDAPLSMASFFMVSAITLFMIIGFRIILHMVARAQGVRYGHEQLGLSVEIPVTGAEPPQASRWSGSRIVSAPRTLAREFLKSRSGSIALVLFAVILACGLLADYIAVSDPVDYSPLNEPWELQPPSSDHPLGTDEYGRDMYSMMLYASRFDILIVLTACLASVAIGLSLGYIELIVSYCSRKSVRRIVDGSFHILRDLAMAAPIAVLLMILIPFRMYELSFAECIIIITASIWFWARSLDFWRLRKISPRRSLSATRASGIRPFSRALLLDFRRHFSWLMSRTLFVSKFVVLLTFVIYGIVHYRFPYPEFWYRNTSGALGSYWWGGSWETLMSSGLTISLREGILQAWWLTIPPIVAIIVLALCSYVILNTLEGIFARHSREVISSHVTGTGNIEDQCDATEASVPSIDAEEEKQG